MFVGRRVVLRRFTVRSYSILILSETALRSWLGEARTDFNRELLILPLVNHIGNHIECRVDGKRICSRPLEHRPFQRPIADRQRGMLSISVGNG